MEDNMENNINNGVHNGISNNLSDYMSECSNFSENQKIRFIYNAIEDGWTVRKLFKRNSSRNDNIIQISNGDYEFTKQKTKINGINEFLLTNYLKKFLKNYLQ